MAPSKTATRFVVHVDASVTRGELKPVWRSFGYDEINWTYTPTGKRLFSAIGKLASRHSYWIRIHHVLTSGNMLSSPTRGSGNVYHENVDGKAFFDFTIPDRVYQTILANGCKPVVELGFMPDALSSGPKPKAEYEYGGNRLWAHPPKDLRKWGELVAHFVEHCVRKFGADEVSTWYFEVWNEPDNPFFFQGTVREYCRLYDWAVAAAAGVLPTIRIGGPALGGRIRFLETFLKHCAGGKNAATGSRGSRLDFLSFHAKGTSWPKPDQKSEIPSLERILSSFEDVVRTLKRHPRFASCEYLFDECDMAVGTHFGMYDFPFYNIHNTEYYPVFVLRLVKALLDLSRKHEIDFSFFTTWAFYAEGKRLFEGNRALFTNFDIPLPVFNAFRILEKLGETRIALNLGEPCRTGTALPPPLVDGLASLSNGRSVTVLLWNSAENPETQKEAWISLSVANLPFDVQSGDVVMYRLDRDHGNAHATWCRIGAPEDPTPDQLKRIRESASCVPVRPEKPPRVRDRSINWRIRLPGPGAVLIHIGRRRSRFISL